MQKYPIPLVEFNRVIHPLPAFVITTMGKDVKPNAISVAWLIPVCHDPAMLVFSVTKDHYSYQLIQQTPAFVVNIMTFEDAPDVNFIGRCSGRDVDKFAQTGLTLVPSEVVNVPSIDEAVAHVECSVEAEYPAEKNAIILGRVVAVRAMDGMLHGKYRNLDVAPPLIHMFSKRFATIKRDDVIEIDINEYQSRKHRTIETV